MRELLDVRSVGLHGEDGLVPRSHADEGDAAVRAGERRVCRRCAGYDAAHDRGHRQDHRHQFRSHPVSPSLALFERWERVRDMDDPTGYLYRTAINAFRKRTRRAALAVRRAIRLAPT